MVIWTWRMNFSHDIGYAHIIIICHNFVLGMATNKKEEGINKPS